MDDVSTAPPAGATASRLRAVTRLFFTLGDQAVVSATSFLSGVIVAKATSKEQFGLYGLGFTIVMIAAELQSALISTPQTVFGPRFQGTRNAQFQGSMLIKLLLLAVLNTLLLLGVAALAQAAGKRDISQLFTAIAAGVTAMHLGAFVRVACFANLNPIGAFCVDIVSCTSQLALLLLLWDRGQLSAATAWLAINLTTLLPAMAFLLFWRRRMRFSTSGVREDFHITWLQTRFVLVSSLLWIGGMYLYAWLIEFFADLRGVAEWTACLAIAAIGNPLMIGVMNILGPQIAHRERTLPRAAFRNYVRQVAVGFFAVMSLFAIAVTLSADWLMTHLYTPEYVGQTAIIAMMTFGFAARVPGFVASRGLFAINRADLELLNNIAPIIVLVGLGIVMTYRYHVAGAAFCMLLAQVIGSLTRIVCFERCMHLEARNNENVSQPAVAAGVRS